MHLLHDDGQHFLRGRCSVEPAGEVVQLLGLLQGDAGLLKEASAFQGQGHLIGDLVNEGQFLRCERVLRVVVHAQGADDLAAHGKRGDHRGRFLFAARHQLFLFHGFFDLRLPQIGGRAGIHPVIQVAFVDARRLTERLPAFLAGGPVEGVEFVEAAFHLQAQAGAVDGDGDLSAQTFEHELVFFTQGAIYIALYIQHAEHFVAQLDRHGNFTFGFGQQRVGAPVGITGEGGAQHGLPCGGGGTDQAHAHR